MKFKHNNQEYELNVEKAIYDGYVKKVEHYPIRSGAVYRTTNQTAEYIVIYKDYTGKLSLNGRHGVSLYPFSDTYTSEEELASYLKEHEYSYIGTFGEISKYVGLLIDKPE